MSTPTSISGRRALITGGGAGIGAATARLLAQRGWRVALLDRDGAAAQRTAEDIGEANACWFQGDVTDPAAIAAALDSMTTTWGGIDDLVNNAGVWDHAPLLDLTLDQWRRVMDVNLLAPIEISNAAVRRMRPGSAIVNVSSVLGQVSAPTRGPYCVSKSALISLTKMQAIEWAERGIRVNAIAPGYIINEPNSNAGCQRQFRSVRDQPANPDGPARDRRGGRRGNCLSVVPQSCKLHHGAHAGSERRLDRLWLPLRSAG